MSSRFTEALANKPKRPLNGYFKFRNQKYKEFGKDESNKKTKFEKYYA